ncbi:MAG TPA: CarD family transcriptional regulator [Methylocystis sp.]|nr:CarD family transcriptional regulator [Methylocystis sp.]
MPSAKKSARSRKAAASAKSSGATVKKARKASVAGKSAKASTSKAAQARRKSASAAARPKSGSAKSTAKSASAKAKTARTARKTVKSAAKSAARSARKTSGASKTRVAAKRPATNRSGAKSSASARARTAVAIAKTVGGKPAATKTVASKTVASKTAPKKPAASAVPPKTAAKPVAPAKINVVSVKAVKEFKTPTVKPAHQVLEPPAQRPAAAPAAVPQSVSEPKEVRQNLSQQPAAKPVANIAANAQVLGKTTTPARPAPVVQKSAAAVGKARAVSQKLGFKLNEFIVYPAHGVGQIVGIETQEVAGFSLELFVVSFVKDKMILKVPTSKAPAVGMRKLSESAVVEKALGTLTGRARIKRTMWSRRAQEYEAKINSGDLVTIAEVVRDLYRSDTQPEQSYSERQLYEAALDRMSREVAAVRKLIDQEALSLIDSFLAKAPRRGPKTEIESEEDVERAA